MKSASHKRTLGLAAGATAFVLVWVLFTIVRLLAARSHRAEPPAPIDMGRAERIVALAPSSVEIVCALGCMDRLVAVGRFCTYPPLVAELPQVGGLYDPELETIIALKPDLLITRGRSDVLERLCADRGIRIFEDPTDTLAGLHQAVREFGELLGRSAEAAALSQRIRDELAAVQKRVADRPVARVLLSMNPAGPTRDIYTIGRGPYLNELIETAGGRNVFADLDVPYPQVSGEEVLARAPEVIVEVVPGGEGGDAAQARALAQWAELGPVPAVEAGRVCVITDDFALIPSPRIPLMAWRLAECIHPEAGADE